MFDVITIGSATVDAFAETDREFVKKGYYSFPVGAKIKISTLNFDTGGGGTNTAVSFARLGLKTSFLGKVGKGNNSKRIIDGLKKEKVDTSLILKTSGRTGFSVIMDAKGTDRTILTFRGNNSDLKFDEIDLKKLKTKWVYISSLTGNAFLTFKKLVMHMRKNTATRIAFNPSLYLVKEKRDELAKLMHYINIIIFNKEEAETLTNVKSLKINSKTPKNRIEQHMKILLKSVYRLGPEIVVITDGANGSYCYDGVYMHFMPANKVRIKETTGAGDAYASAFVATVIKRMGIEHAMMFGTINSESVIQHLGAKNKLLKWKEVLNIAKRYKQAKKVIV